MEIKKDYNLKSLNTFGVEAAAKYFAELNKEEDLSALLSSVEFQENGRMFLGGGSNVLFTKDYDGIVVLNKIKGIEILEDSDEYATIKAMSGEIWHDLVLFTVSRNLWGLENLSLIPGTVGAAPMQNIGAYGAELKNTLLSVEAYDIKTGEKRIFTNDECKLSYRSSIFKTNAKGKYFISAIVLRLSKIPEPNMAYRVLSNYIEENDLKVKSPKDISDAVVAIRESKLPNPKIIGNAGSFFKNAFVDQSKLEALKKIYSEIPSFLEEDKIKIPAGWLIEKCGWKGKRVGNVGVHDKQALVLVNHGGAKGQEIKELSESIITSVQTQFGITLEREVNLI